MPESEWYKKTNLGDGCDDKTHCQDCEPNGVCDSCDSIDGRGVEEVSNYASTCDGCGILTHHGLLEMDEETQLGYCWECQAKPPADVVDAGVTGEAK